MCSKQNRGFKSKRFQHDYRNKWIETLIKHISSACKCKFDGRKCNSNEKWNNDKCRCECKNLKEHHLCKKNYIWNPARYSCKYSIYLASIIDDSVITCDEIIENIKTVSTNFNEKA